MRSVASGRLEWSRSSSRAAIGGQGFSRVVGPDHGRLDELRLIVLAAGVGYFVPTGTRKAAFMSGVRRWYSRVFALLGVISTFALLLPAAASATAPTLQAPASGSSFEAENPPSFTATDDAAAASGVFLSVSTSPAVDAHRQLGTDVTFAEMTPRFASPSVYDWAPLTVANSYPWTPGTYYWQVFHIDCAATPTCDVTSSLWQFVITPVPPPQPILPANNATVRAGTTVEFSVYSSIAGDIATYIEFPSSSGSPITIAPYGIRPHVALPRSAGRPARNSCLDSATRRLPTLSGMLPGFGGDSVLERRRPATHHALSERRRPWHDRRSCAMSACWRILRETVRPPVSEIQIRVRTEAELVSARAPSWD